MIQEEVLEEFKKCGAMLEGHFILSSGLHSPVFLQKMFVFMYPDITAKLCKALAEKVRQKFGNIDTVISPAMGGIIPGYETARYLNAKAMFVEREQGEFTLRRGFEIKENEKILMVEDIITTGLSSRECLKAIADLGGNVIGAACLIDRSNGHAELPVERVSLATLDIPSYQPDEVPSEMAAIPAIKPGSRALQA